MRGVRGVWGVGGMGWVAALNTTCTHLEAGLLLIASPLPPPQVP